MGDGVRRVFEQLMHSTIEGKDGPRRVIGLMPSEIAAMTITQAGLYFEPAGPTPTSSTDMAVQSHLARSRGERLVPRPVDKRQLPGV